MKAHEFLYEDYKRLDPEFMRTLKLAKAKYPMYDEDTALLKFLQRSSKHGEESDAAEDAAIADLKKKTVELDRRVTKLEKGK